MLQGTFGYVEKNTSWELDKLLKATHSIFKIPSASSFLESHDANKGCKLLVSRKDL